TDVTSFNSDDYSIRTAGGSPPQQGTIPYFFFFLGAAFFAVAFFFFLAIPSHPLSSQVIPRDPVGGLVKP
ncbi:MAG: hypothetical protein ACE5G5_03215, partial [Candidatus Methylomirabilales bacterium]